MKVYLQECVGVWAGQLSQCSLLIGSMLVMTALTGIYFNDDGFVLLNIKQSCWSCSWYNSKI